MSDMQNTMTFTYDEAIEWLVDDDIDDLQQMFANGDFTYIGDLLKGGFCGYYKYTKEQLVREISERGGIEVIIQEHNELHDGVCYPKAE